MPTHSSSEALLKGTEYQQSGQHEGKTIKAIVKGDWDNKRVIKFTDGTSTVANRVALRAAIDVELDRRLLPKMESTLVKHRDGTASVKIGGPVQGEVHDYKTVGGAKVALRNHYSQDFEKYKEMRADDGQRCRKK